MWEIHFMSRVRQILARQQKRRAQLQAALESVSRQLQDRGAVRIIVFGSIVREQIDVDSDLDLLVIMPSTKSSKEWMNLIYDEVERGVAADILVFNEQEFNSNLPGSTFLQNIVDSGRVIHEKAA
jgi:predicted nucleotidyltransferase